MAMCVYVFFPVSSPRDIHKTVSYCDFKSANIKGILKKDLPAMYYTRELDTLPLSCSHTYASRWDLPTFDPCRGPALGKRSSHAEAVDVSQSSTQLEYSNPGSAGTAIRNRSMSSWRIVSFSFP